MLVVADGQTARNEPAVLLDTSKQGEVAQAARARFGPEALIREIPAFPPPGNIGGCIRQSLRETDRTIVLASASCGAFKGTAHLSRPVVNLLEGLAPKIDAVVMLGNPWAALDLPPVPRVVFGYRGAHTVEAAMDVLFGKAKAAGTLPVPATPPGF